MDWKLKKIAVILGGFSKEREVSLRTGQAILMALSQKGYNVEAFDPKEQNWASFSARSYDVAFLALHGWSGEDGTVQGYLETLGVPYTASGVQASANCMDKARTKALLRPTGITMAQEWFLGAGQSLEDFMARLPQQQKVIVKPNREGSTVGMTIVPAGGPLVEAVQNALAFDREVLVEEFIEGREMTVGLLHGRALGVVEIRPKSGVYDYHAKYTPGETEYLSPAPVDEALRGRLFAAAELAFKSLGCRGAARADFIVRGDEPFFLEVNTIPGMTETSLLPKAAAAAGLSFADLCESILLDASLKR